MPVELLLLLLAWAATTGLVVVLPWLLIRVAVGVIEADVSKPGADHERAQSHQYSDEPADAPLAGTSDERVEPIEAVAPATTSNEDADSADG